MLDPLVPALRLTLAGEAESVNPAAALIVIATVVELVEPPPVPVTVIIPLPAAFAAAPNVSVVEPVALAGLNVAVTPGGIPLAE